MNLDIAGASDNQELLDFYKEFPLKGLVEFKRDRKSDYFAAYKIHSEDYRTYVLRDEDKKIQATASFALRDVFQNGKTEKIAYATDLRVAPHRRAILEWSHHFLPLMESVRKEFNVENFFSSINLDETSGHNLFVRPRTMKRPLPRYFLYRKFNLISLHGRFPWAPKPLEHVKIRPGSSQNLEALLAYILKRSVFRQFSSIWDMESFLKKNSRLSNFDFSHFLVAFDANENVVGCMAPWRPDNVLDWIPISYSLRAHNFRQFLKFCRLFGWSRTLSKPVRSTGYESPLKFQYLTNIHVDNEDIFESLLYRAYENISEQEFLLYSQVEQDIRVLPPASWISAKMPHALYSVVAPHLSAPSFLHPSINHNPEIEAYLI